MKKNKNLNVLEVQDPYEVVLSIKVTADSKFAEMAYERGMGLVEFMNLCLEEGLRYLSE